jgi:hypothetical protein
MDEFLHWDPDAMSNDETTRIEPTLIVNDAPSIASEQSPAIELKAESEAKPETAAAESKAETPVTGTITPEAWKAEAFKDAAPKDAAPKDEAAKIEVVEPAKSDKGEAPPAPAPQADPVVVVFKKSQAASLPAATPAAPQAPARSTRFALLAASVAIAASFGAIGGSLGAAKFGPMIASTPEPVAPVAKEQVAEEVRALKESVAQLRATTKSLSDNFATLKSTVTTASTQNGKIAETLDRIEKAQTEQRKVALSAPATVPAHVVSTTQAAPQAAPEVTGSIAPKQAAPMVLGSPPATLKPPTVQGFVLRRVYDGAALIEGRDGMIEVEPGIVAPGLGRIEAIKREDGRWVVVTARGIVR